MRPLPSPESIEDAASPDRQPKTLSDAAYRAIRADLIAGRYDPGSRLAMEQLKLAHGMGSSPLREALSRLVSEGLVTLEGQRGFRAAGVSIEELEDVTPLRIMLETRALAQSIERGGDAWENGIVATHYQLAKATLQVEGFEEWEDRNRAFHHALIAGCTSRWLLTFLGVLYDQHERYRRISLAHPELPRNIAEEHRELMEATLARDVEGATAILTAHIQRTADLVRRILERRNALEQAAEMQLRTRPRAPVTAKSVPRMRRDTF